MFDTHVHSTFSGDGKIDMQGYLETMGDLGVKGIGFTEHMDFLPECGSYGYFNYEKYWNAIHFYRKQGYVIFGGVEIDFISEIQSEIIQYVKNNPFDYTIASVHCVDGVFISDKKELELLQNQDYLLNMMDKYYAEITCSIEVDEFDVIGHIGIFKRHLSRAYLNGTELRDKINRLEDELAKKLAKSSKIVEVNTSGLFSKLGEIIPGKSFLEAYYRYGGRRISLGSDAHTAENLAGGFEETKKSLKEIGFTSIVFPWVK